MNPIFQTIICYTILRRKLSVPKSRETGRTYQKCERDPIVPVSKGLRKYNDDTPQKRKRRSFLSKLFSKLFDFD